MILTTKELLLARLPRTEGRRNKPYLDTAGKWTVGVGHNISDNGLPPKMIVELLEKGILSDESIKELLNVDVTKAINGAEAIPAYKGLGPVRQSVLADMVFNMGLGKVLQFTNTLMYIGRGDWKSAATQMLKSKWAEQVGNRAIELARIMESGEIKPSTKVVA